MNFIFELFANEILPVLMIILAIVGNLLGLIVLKKPNVNKIWPIHMHKYLLIFGLINSYMILIFCRLIHFQKRRREQNKINSIR